MGVLTENPGDLMGGIGQGLQLYQAIANNGRQQQRLALDDQQAASDYRARVADQDQQAALRPIALEQAKRQQALANIQSQARLAMAHKVINDSSASPEMKQRAHAEIDQQYGHLINNDGTGKTLHSFVPTPDGQGQVAVLNTPQPDGTVTQNPLTENRSSDPEDQVVVFPKDYHGQQADAHVNAIAQQLGIHPDDVHAALDDNIEAMHLDMPSALKANPDQPQAEPAQDEDYGSVLNQATMALGGQRVLGRPERIGDEWVQKDNDGKYSHVANDYHLGVAQTNADGRVKAAEIRTKAQANGVPSRLEKDFAFLSAPVDQGGMGLSIEAAKAQVLGARDGTLKLPAQVAGAKIRWKLQNGLYTKPDGTTDNDAIDADTVSAGGAQPVSPNPAPNPQTKKQSGLSAPIVPTVPLTDSRYVSFQRHYEAARAQGNTNAMTQMREAAQRLNLIK